jgi:hypothetical protein
MADGQSDVLPSHTRLLDRCRTSVTHGSHGGWVTTIDLGEGASVSRWFPEEQDAHRYPQELAEWLMRGRG